jgi:hypothetical protein
MARILYAGDTSLDTAASYLAGVLTHAGLPFDYVPSDQPAGGLLAAGPHALYIVSDYPVNRWRAGELATLRQRVSDGAGLLMIGGWESFHGAAGEYVDTPLAEVLPVEMARGDDRVNCPQPCMVELAAPADETAAHPILAGLPWDRPPGIGGFNRVVAKASATMLLVARPFAVQAGREGWYDFVPGAPAPLLVVGAFGRGRVAAFTSDVAPHWVGGLVDWGDSRVTARAPGAEAIEVGNWYAAFFAQLVRWTNGSSLG